MLHVGGVRSLGIRVPLTAHLGDIAQRPVLNHLVRQLKAPVEPLHVRRHQDDAVPLGGINHTVALIDRARHRFLAEHVLARFGNLDHMLGMQIMGCGDNHAVYFRIKQHLVNASIGALCAVHIARFFGFLLGNIDSRDELAVIQVSEHRHVHRHRLLATQNCYAYSCHLPRLPDGISNSVFFYDLCKIQPVNPDASGQIPS